MAEETEGRETHWHNLKWLMTILLQSDFWCQDWMFSDKKSYWFSFIIELLLDSLIL